MQIRRCMHRGMRNRGGDVAEKRLAGFRILFNEIEGCVHDQIMDIGPLFQRHFFPVANDATRIVSMGDALVFPAGKMIKAMRHRVHRARIASLAKAPLPVSTGSVTGVFKQPRQGCHFRIQRRSPFAAVPTTMHMPRMLARHQNRARRRANRIARVVIGKQHPFIRKAIDIRRLEFLLPVAAEIAVAKVVRQNVDDVRLGRNRGGTDVIDRPPSRCGLLLLHGCGCFILRIQLSRHWGLNFLAPGR